MRWIGTKVVTNRILPIMAAALVLAVAMPAHAAIQFQNLGTGAPPATLGGLPMTPFIQQGACEAPPTTTIPGCPIPGSLTVSPELYPAFIGCGWATWSHGYTGDVYMDYPAEVPATTVVLTLPPGTTAFYLYAEPDPFAVWSITATTNTGATSGAIPIDGNGGANGFGFYTDGADTIATITINSDVDFAIGEFGISNAVVWDRSFIDDNGRAQFCVNFKSGAYQWSILSGPGAGMTYNGTAKVLNANQKVVSFPGAANALNFTFDKLKKKAQGYFMSTEGYYSVLYDRNTADDPPGCASVRPTSPDLQ